MMLKQEGLVFVSLALTLALGGGGCSTTKQGKGTSEDTEVDDAGTGGAEGDSGGGSGASGAGNLGGSEGDGSGGSGATSGAGAADGTGGDETTGAPDPCAVVIEEMDLFCSDYGNATVKSDETWSAGCRSYKSLTIEAGRVAVETDPFGDPSVIIVDTLDVAADAAIHSNAKGYASGIGPGKGLPSSSWGSGGGHGGVGGERGTAGGATYGDPAYPITAGSGGGMGGAGGGALLICARNSISVGGSIESHGQNGGAGGGGAGGSLLLISPLIVGDGVVSVTGGAATSSICAGAGGAGGGGRVSLRTADDQFTGSVDAQGGPSSCGGVSDGGDGTIYHGDLP